MRRKIVIGDGQAEAMIQRTGIDVLPAMGWPEIVLSESYTVDGGYAWSAFSSARNLRDDERSPSGYAPRVVEVAT